VSPAKEFEDLMLSILKDEEKTLKDGLVAMPSRPGCYPGEFSFVSVISLGHSLATMSCPQTF
jgi:hypothetical protein